jgi:hypothetical protein
MTNTNCLKAMKCPKCGSEGPFRIECTSMFTMYDDGTEDFEDVLYNGESYCMCPQCDHDGKIHDFKKEAAA